MTRDLEPERVTVGGDARGEPVWFAGELDELRLRRERVAVDVGARKRVAGDGGPGVVERRDVGERAAALRAAHLVEQLLRVGDDRPAADLLDRVVVRPLAHLR